MRGELLNSLHFGICSMEYIPFELRVVYTILLFKIEWDVSVLFEKQEIVPRESNFFLVIFTTFRSVKYRCVCSFSSMSCNPVCGFPRCASPHTGKQVLYT